MGASGAKRRLGEGTEMLRVRVHLFGALREAAGERQGELDLEPGATAGDVKAAAESRWPGLRGHLGGVALAVNLEYAVVGRVLADGDEVALIPPVSGG